MVIVFGHVGTCNNRLVIVVSYVIICHVRELCEYIDLLFVTFIACCSSVAINT